MKSQTEKTKEIVKETYKDGVILELRNDVSSSVAGLLCSRALKGTQVHAIYLLNRETHSQLALRNINRIARIGKFNLSVIEVTNLFKSFLRELPMIRRGRPPGDQSKRERVAGDFLSRLRMSIMYYYSDTYDHAVCTSVNRSDFLLGGATLWGEWSGDLFPLISLYKTQVDMVARLLRIGFMVDPRNNFVPSFSSRLETLYYDLDPVLVGIDEGWKDDEIHEDVGVDLNTISLARERSESCRDMRGRAIKTWLKIDSTTQED